MAIKKRGKKGQSANEAAMLITFLTFFLIITLAAVSDDIISASDNNYKALIQDIAGVIEQEAMIAFSSENGYYHAFNLPQSLNGQPYSVGFLNSTAIGSQANSSILFVSSENTNIPLNVTRLLPRDVHGNLIIGRVSLKKENGLVIISSKPFPPLISAVTPSSGTIYGSTPVTITGANFANTPGVSFGGVAATGVALLNQFTLQALTPAHAAGAVDVTVTNPDGQSDTLSNGYNYISPPPSVTGVSPSSGTYNGGTTVTVNGANFYGTPAVKFGGVASPSVTFVSSSQLTVVTPAHAVGAVDVSVTNPDGQSATLSNGFTYNLPPSVTGVSPSSGPTAGGTIVSITGFNFVSGAGVKFGGVASPSVTFVSSSQLTAVTPAHAQGFVNVVVTNPDGQSATLSNGFTYNPPPSVTGVSPSSGTYNGGTTVTISGSNLVSGAGVKFGGVASPGVTFVNSNTLQAITPAYALNGPVSVTVTNPDGQSGTLSNGFTYTGAPPTILNLNPSSGSTAGGTSVTITGSNFVSGAGVKFGGVASPSVTFVSSSQLTVVTPAHTAGTVDVTVTNPDGQSATLSNGFTFNPPPPPPPPSVTDVSPSSGPSTGGTSVTITGTNFVSGAGVAFGGTAASGVVWLGSTQLTAVTPAHAAGAVDVKVTNPDEQFDTLTNGFNYYLGPAPVVTGVSPSSGPTSAPVSGVTFVAITGTNFVPASTVTFGGVDAGVWIFKSSTQINVHSPHYLVGTVDVTVTNPDGQSGTKSGAFTYVAAPTVTDVSPSSGPSTGGTSVTITGTNFVATPSVNFGGVVMSGSFYSTWIDGGVAAASVTFVSSTALQVIAPAYAVGAVNVIVINPDPDGQVGSKSGAFTYE